MAGPAAFNTMVRGVAVKPPSGQEPELFNMVVRGVAVGRSEAVGLDRTMPRSQSVDPTLLATAAELNLSGEEGSSDKTKRGARPWLDKEDGADDELAKFVCEENLTPHSRDDMAAAAGLLEGVLERILAQTLEEVEPASSPYKEALQAASAPFRERLLEAATAENVDACLDWSRLLAVDSTDALRGEAAAAAADGGSSCSGAGQAGRRAKACVEININSGGQVFFGLLSPAGGEGREEAVVIKFCNSRHMLQSEQMAAELAWHLEVKAPMSRILLKAHDSEEWQALAAATEALCPELSEIMGRKQSLLLLQFIPGSDLKTEKGAWSPERLAATAHELGRLLVLDLLLGNADRLPVQAMMWRGNPSNVLFREPRVDQPGYCVPFDAVVARRPPRLLVQQTDQQAACLLELVLLDRRCCHEALMDVVSCNCDAQAAVEADWEPTESAWAEKRGGASAGHSAVNRFHAGVRAALDLAMSEQGLLEMVVDVVESWLANFRADMNEFVGKCRALSITGLIKDVDKQASKNEEVRDRLHSWQALLQQKSIALAQAAAEWAARRRAGAPPLAFRGFLGASVLNPVADAYELLVRLRQLVARGKVIAEACEATRPSDLSPHPLLVGPATSACCFHLLRKIGVTLIVNCTEDIPEPTKEALGGIAWHRLALADVEEQDLGAALEEGLSLIDEAKASNGRVLVHCHEGKSRSISMCLAYLMTREKLPLAAALDFVKGRRKQARPNVGFMRQLSDLEFATLGSRSVAPEEMPKGKPKMLVCEICGQAAGLSEEALAAHMRSKHPPEQSSS